VIDDSSFGQITSNFLPQGGYMGSDNLQLALADTASFKKMNISFE